MMFRRRIPADEARSLFLEEVKPLIGLTLLQIEESDGRIIAEDIIAGSDVPHYRRAAMDGFAVIASDTLGAGPDSPVVLRPGKRIENGVCAWVHTGSPVPHGADAVVMLEDTAMHEGMVEIFSQIHPFKNVGEIGEDIRKGETVIRKGHKLRPCDIAVLIMLGIRNINVMRKPLVAIIPTGEELVPRWKRELREGEVYETNGLMADLYIRKWGGLPRLLDVVTDDPDKIKEAVVSSL
ncbi:MAG TPA: molybdopterin molybdotransferase MoeA, partial [Candidatus Methanoperedens sp.]